MRGLMVTMVKSSDSELLVLDFPRARNLRRACAVRKLGIWKRDCIFSRKHGHIFSTPVQFSPHRY